MRRELGWIWLAVVLLVVGAAPPVRAAGPVATGIRLEASPGFSATSEVVTGSGAVIDTFTSGDIEVKVIGWPGGSVKLGKSDDVKTGRTTVSVELKGKRPKTEHDRDRYAKSGRSAVGDLVALGVDPKVARDQFADMDVIDQAAGTERRQWASTRMPATEAILGAATPSSTSAYDVQCATVHAAGGEVVGQGCSTVYLVAISAPGDWWFNSKWKFSAHGTQPNNAGCFFTGLGCPWRVFQLGWSLGWSKNNVVYDWDPASTITKSSCSSTTVDAAYMGFQIGVTTDICPDKLQPWRLTGRTSGTEWIGIQRGTDWQATIGTQANHSPPNAAASFSSPFSIQFARLNT